MKAFLNWAAVLGGAALGIDLKWYAHQPWWLLALMILYGGLLALAGYFHGRKPKSGS